MSKTTDKAAEGTCPVTTVLDLAKTTATTELGVPAGDKSVSASATLATSVTEGGKVKKQTQNATVTVGVSSSEEDAPAAKCCDKCGSDCCK
jgi:hypothetical protein